jgi:hypothetical protein
VETAEYADGARRDRRADVFTLRLAPGGLLVARLGAGAHSLVSFHADGKRLSQVELGGGLVQEVSVALSDVSNAPHDIQVLAEDGGAAFDSLHYWSYR